MESNKMKFHITITDNETGETLHDSDTIAIIGVFHDGEEAHGIGYTLCNPLRLAHTLRSCENVLDATRERNPELGVLEEIIGLFGGPECEIVCDEHETIVKEK
ncbi:MAG: hypothetical protein IKY89_05680 [Alistipes sp.]|nr:hypothetical protein [Alistipes sp.]